MISFNFDVSSYKIFVGKKKREEKKGRKIIFSKEITRIAWQKRRSIIAPWTGRKRINISLFPSIQAGRKKNQLSLLPDKIVDSSVTWNGTEER